MHRKALQGQRTPCWARRGACKTTLPGRTQGVSAHGGRRWAFQAATPGRGPLSPACLGR